MSNHINVTIESSARFRPDSTTSDQKQNDPHNASWHFFGQVLKAMVMIAALAGAGVALGWFFGLFEPTSPAQLRLPGSVGQAGHSSLGGDAGKGVVPVGSTPPFGHPSRGDGVLPVLSSAIRPPVVGLDQGKAVSGRSRRAESQSMLGLSASPSAPTPIMIALMELGSVATGQAEGVTLNPAGTIAFVANQNTGLVVVNVTDPMNPYQLGKGVAAVGAQGVTLNPAGTIAFVANKNTGLVVVNVTDPVNPYQLGRGVVTGQAYDVTLNPAGTIAFVANGNTGLVVVNVADPVNPYQLGGAVATGQAVDIALNPAGTIAFVANQNTGLVVVNVTDPMNPYQLGNGVATGEAWGIALNPAGTIAFVANWNTGLVVVNVTDPVNPYQLGRGVVTGQAYDVTLNPAGTIAFVANGNTGLVVVNVTDPMNPYQLGNGVATGLALGVTLNPAETIAFVANYDAGLVMVKTESILSLCILPKIRGGVHTGLAWGIALNPAGTIAFVANLDTGLVVVNVTDPVNPYQLGGAVATGQAVDIALNPAGTIAFVANWNTGLVLVNVTDSVNPYQLGKGVATGVARGITLNSAGTIAFVENYDAGLVVVNVTDPVNPYQLGKGVPTGQAVGITLNPAGTIAFVANGNTGLVIVNVADPMNPHQLGKRVATGQAVGITLNPAGTIAFVANGNTGLVIVNVTDPVNPYQLGKGVATGEAWGIALNPAGTIAFVTNQDSGLVVVNVTDPMNPYQLGKGVATGQAQGVTLNPAGTIAFVANSDTGLVVAELYSPYVAIPLVFSGDVMASKQVLKVGQPNEGKTFFFVPENKTAVNPVITAVNQIDSQHEKNSLPYWMSFSKVDYQFSGIPTKDWTGKELLIRFDIEGGDAAQCSVFIESSLLIDATSSRLSIQSPGTLGSLSIQLSNPAAGRFVNQPFSGISFTFDPTSGTGNGVGTIVGFNKMFQDLQFSMDDPDLFNATSVSMTVDDTVNQPQTASGIPLGKFTPHQPPVLNPGVLLNQSASALKPFDFVIPENTFLPHPHSLTLAYNVSSLPSWLTYTPITRQLSGTPPLSTLGQFFDMSISANDGYKNASTPWRLSIYSNQPPMIGSLLNGTTAIVNQPFTYSIANGFISNNTLHYSASATSGPALYSWMRLDQNQGILSGQPTESDLGNYPVMVIASDLYGGSENQTFTVFVADPNAAAAERLQNLQNILKIVGYAVSAAGTAFTVYKNKALIRNIWTGKSYAKEGSEVFNEEGVYQLGISPHSIKEIRMYQKTPPDSCRKRALACITKPLSHHIHEDLVLSPRNFLTWVEYDKETNALRLDKNKLPEEESEYRIHIVDTSDHIVEGIELMFPWGRAQQAASDLESRSMDGVEDGRLDAGLLVEAT